MQCLKLFLLLISFSVHTTSHSQDHFVGDKAQNEIDSNVLRIIHEQFFDGYYIGINGGSQNIFGGSFVDGKDVLAQDSRFVLEIFTGFRKQLINERLLIGVEFQFGFANGDLVHSDPENELFITYENSTQYGYGLNLGVVVGRKKNFLIFIYGGETKRKFDVTIDDSEFVYKQTDKQGMFKYGAGIELHIYKGLNIQAKAGGLSVDFGDLETNIDVEGRLDYNIGLLYQF